MKFPSLHFKTSYKIEIHPELSLGVPFFSEESPLFREQSLCLGQFTGAFNLPVRKDPQALLSFVQRRQKNTSFRFIWGLSSVKEEVFTAFLKSPFKDLNAEHFFHIPSFSGLKEGASSLKNTLDTVLEEISLVRKRTQGLAKGFVFTHVHPRFPQFQANWLKRISLEILPHEKSIISMAAFSHTADAIHPYILDTMDEGLDLAKRFNVVFDLSLENRGKGVWPLCPVTFLKKNQIVKAWSGFSGAIWSMPRSVYKDSLAFYLLKASKLQFLEPALDEAVLWKKTTEGSCWAGVSLEQLARAEDLRNAVFFFKERRVLREWPREALMERVEYVLALINLFKRETSLVPEELKKIFMYFIVDMQRMLWYFLHNLGLQINGIYKPDSNESTFWTRIALPPRLGSVFPTVEIFKEPLISL